LRQTFVAVQGKEALQLVWRGFRKVHCGEHFGADLPDPNQVQERCGRLGCGGKQGNQLSCLTEG
jgi:hypothetical protein